MIGSHNSFSYLPPVNKIFKLFSGLWRCQCKTITEQYGKGVRFFDIRVVYHKHKWWLAHGLIRLKKSFYTLLEICEMMSLTCPEAIYRIVLERGDLSDELQFIEDTADLCSLYPNLWRLDIKASKNWMGQYGNNNQALYDKGYKFALGHTWDEPSHEIRGYAGIESLKSQAKDLNRSIPDDYTSKDNLYLIDYCTKEYD